VFKVGRVRGKEVGGTSSWVELEGDLLRLIHNKLPRVVDKLPGQQRLSASRPGAGDTSGDSVRYVKCFVRSVSSGCQVDLALNNELVEYFPLSPNEAEQELEMSHMAPLGDFILF